MALADSDPQRLQEAKERAPEAIAVAQYHDLLAMPEVEAVLICLPSALHAEAAVAALERGKHVYLEKPLATTLADACAVLAAERRAGVTTMIGFNLRFHPLFQAAKQHVQAGRLGALVGVRSVLTAGVSSLAPWKQRRESGGGVLLDLASHHIDLVHFLFEQRVQEVSAEVWSQRSEDDSAMLHLRLADGLRVQSFFSLHTVEEDRFEIYGQTGKLAVDRHWSVDVEMTQAGAGVSRKKLLSRSLRSLTRSPFALEKIAAPRREPSYHTALEHFVMAVRAGQSASPNFRDGYRSLAVIAAAEEAAQTRRIVSPRELVDEDFTGQ